ncbi:MAG: hypothetical protein OWT28_05890 [Firmicutes bacterium]|nr:hypothetical protein [Bacillota bacterium]
MVTVQRAIEMVGIPTVLITLDPHQSGLMRPSRAMYPEGFVFGHSLGKPFDKDTQTAVLRAALTRLVTQGEPGVIETVSFASY